MSLHSHKAVLGEEMLHLGMIVYCERAPTVSVQYLSLLVTVFQRRAFVGQQAFSR